MILVLVNYGTRSSVFIDELTADKSSRTKSEVPGLFSPPRFSHAVNTGQVIFNKPLLPE